MVAYTEERWAGLNLLASMMVLQIRDNRSYSEHDVRRALWKMKEWIDQEEELQREYGTMFEFMNRSHILTHHLIERNYDQIEQEVKTSPFLVLDNRISHSLACMFSKLSEIKGEDAYFLYLSQALTAAECVLSRNGRQYELREARHTVLKSCQTIANSDRFAGMTEEPAMKKLVSHLNQALFGSDDRV